MSDIVLQVESEKTKTNLQLHCIYRLTGRDIQIMKSGNDERFGESKAKEEGRWSLQEGDLVWGDREPAKVSDQSLEQSKGAHHGNIWPERLFWRGSMRQALDTVWMPCKNG